MYRIYVTLTCPGKQKTDSSVTSCSTNLSSELKSGKLGRSSPTIMYIAPCGITGDRPGTCNNDSNASFALFCTAKTHLY